jgi:glutamate synthase (NADPH/NADH) large chain
MVTISRIADDDGAPPGVGDDPTREELLAEPLRYDRWRLKTLISRHARLTNSSRAWEILRDFDSYVGRFYKVTPDEFRRVLEETHAAPATAAVGGS